MCRNYKKKIERLNEVKHTAKCEAVLGRQLLQSDHMQTKEVFRLSESSENAVATLKLSFGKDLLKKNGVTVKPVPPSFTSTTSTRK